METIEYILLTLAFIVIVIQTIRVSYFKTNYKTTEELKNYYVEKCNDSNRESDQFEKANMYLRDKIETLKQHLTLKINRLNYLENSKKELEHKINCYRDNMNDTVFNNKELNYHNIELKNRIKVLEAAIANTSVKPIKPLNTALDEMNKTADKYTPKRGEYILAVDPFQSEAEKLPNIHEVLKRYDAMKGIHNSYEHQIADKLSFGSRASEAYASYFGGNHESPKDIKLNVDSDEDQYNTVNEEQEVNSECDCVNCKAMRNEAKYYQDWRKKQKSGYRKETDYDS